MKKNRVVIIPARAGSKRIPNKNTYLIDGIPIVARTINLLKETGLFSKIVVSTDSSTLIEMCGELGVDSHGIRPNVLANDTAPLSEVIQYEVDKLFSTGQIFDELWLYSATACLLTHNDLVDASKMFAHGDKSIPLISVVKSHTPIEWAMRIGQSGVLIPNDKKLQEINSQQFQESYFDAGCFAVYDYMALATNAIDFPSIAYRAYVLPRHRGIDVDNLEDMELIEKIIQSN